MQIRTPLQHAWATAVETVDTFYRQGLKAHRGTDEWRRFFSLMGAAIAIREGTRAVPGTPRNESDLKSELRTCAEKLEVIPKLRAFGETLKVIGRDDVRRRGIKYVILSLNTAKSTVTLFGYPAGALPTATGRYAELERDKEKGGDAVLVSVSDVANLARAYPNYFLDTTVFLRTLEEIITPGGVRPSRRLPRRGRPA